MPLGSFWFTLSSLHIENVKLHFIVALYLFGEYLSDSGVQFETLFDTLTLDLTSKGFSVQKGALPGGMIGRLRGTLLSLNQIDFKQAGVGREQHHRSNKTVRGDSIFWIENHEGAQAEWLEFTSRLQQHLNRNLMLGLFTFESHFAHYAPGAFYKTHRDAFKGQANRILSVVLYLNEEWGEDDGGEMVLYSDSVPSEVLCRAKPEAGTLVVFLSEDFPHEVLAAKRDRYSIAGWYRVNTSSGIRVDPPK